MAYTAKIFCAVIEHAGPHAGSRRFVRHTVLVMRTGRQRYTLRYYDPTVTLRVEHRRSRDAALALARWYVEEVMHGREPGMTPSRLLP